MERQRQDIYWNLSGIARFIRTPQNFKHPLPYMTSFEICVCLPEEEQLVRSHPQMIERLTRDFTESELRSLQCSSGNFYQHLKSGKANMGHVAAEIWSICFDRFSSALGLGHLLFHERVKARYPSDNPEGVEYKILLFIGLRKEENRDDLDRLVRTGRLNALIGGLEYLIIGGYLNACMRGFPFDIKKMLAQTVEHRQLWRRGLQHREPPPILVRPGYSRTSLARGEPPRNRGR